MFIKQEYFFWRLAHHLVTVHNFDILYVNTTEQELWLEKDYNRKTHVVRLRHTQMNWTNQVKRDLNIMYNQVKRSKRSFINDHIILHALYVSEYPPVDWESAENENLISHSHQKSSINVYFLDDVNKEDERDKFYKSFNLSGLESGPYPHIEEMEAAIPYLKQQVIMTHKRRQKEKQSLFQFGTPRITYLLLISNIMMFLFMEWEGDSTAVTTLIDFGAKYTPAILDGEWWRIISSMFLHIGFLHLFMNMLALYYLGPAVERIYGNWRFTIIYFLSGILGGVASFMLNPQVAAGASGAIFGLFGALLYFGAQHRALFFKTMGWNLIFVIFLNIAFGIFVPQVDNGAHIGGLIGGLISSAIIHLPRHKRQKTQYAAAISYVVLLILMFIAGFNNIFNNEQTIAQVHLTQELNEAGNYDKVISQVTEALDSPGKYEAALRFNRAYAYTQTSQLDKAQRDFEKVVKLSPDMAEAHYNLAIIYQKTDQLAQAKEHSAIAVELKPDNKDFQALLKELQ